MGYNMDSSAEYSRILGLLNEMVTGQGELRADIKMVIERIDQRDCSYNKQFDIINDGLKDAKDGRKVLHKRQDDFQVTIDGILPTINRTRDVFKNIGKILWGLAGIVFLAILFNNLPSIIEVLK